ncbi:MAG: UDP-glucose 4-epimerase GalE [Candidatus Eisenbacteria bacterium]|nr:UDP-glucose 4-epimerase GalE [Candidatus Eisenbacteria bacterium]MCC7143863.1 UDP-glucose 4-epimerase GalE [Candidatus Eisenbacteria bacterium]
MPILVTGGGGYIGSVVVDALSARGESVVVADDLARGHREAVAPDVPLRIGDLTDPGFVRQLFAEFSIDAILHFAAWSQVGESMREPGKYFRNNYVGVLNLLEALVASGGRSFILSSTAATYGEPTSCPIDEASPTLPTNPYGASKLQCEQLLRWFGELHGLRWTALRYFNAAGATAERGEDHEPETHLIPLALRTLVGGSPLTVFGLDYPTPDGTCIRDYIHVSDLADAHLLALDALGRGEGGAYNLGNGTGFSVLEVIAAAESVTGRTIPWQAGPRRAGDPARLVASSGLARERLGWSPSRGDIRVIVESAWRWMERHPRGYRGA